MTKTMLEQYLNKVICGDCLEIMKNMPDKSIDLIITSPPYNKNGFRGKKETSKGRGRWKGSKIEYDIYDDNLNEKDYQLWQIKILNECYRILKDDGSIFYNHKIRRANNKANHPIEWIIKSDCNFYQQIIWDRGGGCDHNLGYLDITTEIIFWLTKKIPKVFKNKCIFQKEIWRFNPDIGNKHPAPFPVKMAASIIQLVSKENDIVLDPFLGSGTTAVACQNLKRNFIGIEISEKYCEIARQRLRQQTLI